MIEALDIACTYNASVNNLVATRTALPTWNRDLRKSAIRSARFGSGTEHGKPYERLYTLTGMLNIS